MVTAVRGRWVVGHHDGGHVVIPDGEVVYDGATIVFVGAAGGFAGSVDQLIDAGRSLVMPGLISTHLHSDLNAGDYNFLDAGRPDMWGRNYLNWQAGLPGRARTGSSRTSMTFGLAQALRSGTTTTVEIGGGAGPSELFAEVVGELGIRTYSGPSYRNVTMSMTDSGRISYDHDAGRGRAGLERAIAFARDFDGAAGGLLRAILCPGHPDTCDEDVLRDTAAAADDLGLPVTIHGAINVHEVFHTFDAYGCSPIELLARTGLLRRDVIIGHGIFLTGHSAVPGERGRDLELLGAAGASVSTSPYKYLQLGYLMESFQRLLDAGVNMTIGTDFSPADIALEMRYAMLGSRVADRSYLSTLPRDVFNAATVNAANALGRPDLGRLEAGARADITVVDLDKMRFGAVSDPIRAFVEQASGSDVSTVVVDGRTVVENSRLVSIDETRLLREGQAAADQLWAEVPAWSWGARSIDDMVPPSFPFVHVEETS